MEAVPSYRLPLSERLRPTHLDRLVGNVRAREELRAWADRWRSGRPPARRAALLVGPPGVGKTSAALALANDVGWTVVEMNASDARNQAAIERVAGRASISHTLTEAVKGREPPRALILLDEADCLTGRASEPSRPAVEPPSLREFLRGRYGTVESLNAAWALGGTPRLRPFAEWSAVPNSPGNFAWGRIPAARKDIEEWRASGKPVDTSDRGGLGAIARLARSTRQPLVLTVNDDRPLTRYSPVFRTAAQRIRFYPIRPDELTARLSEVARSERILLAPGALPAIVSRAHGDLRAALNDLEAIAPLPAGPLQLEVLGGRDRTADFAELTAEALSVARLYRSGEVRDRLDAPPDDLLPWIEENIVHFAPDPAHRASAFRTLAVAEQFLSRARRFRTYGQWSYASELLTGGVGLTIRDRPIPAVGEAAFPRFLGEMGRSGAMRAVRESLVAKIAGRFHLSRKKVRATLLWELEGIFGAGRGGARSRRALIGATAIARELELTPEEVAFLLATAPGDPGVVAILGPGPEGSSPGTMDTAEGERSPEESPPQAPTDEATERAKKPVQRRLGEFPP